MVKSGFNMIEMIGQVVYAVAFIFICTLLGAFSSVVVGIFFSNAILSTLAGFGATGLSMWGIGATLGFIVGFIGAN